MGVFEDVVFNAKTAANTVGKTAERLVDISRLRMNAAEVSGEISKKYEALGRLVYDSFKSGASADNIVAEYVESIDALSARHEEINEKINQLRNRSVCPVCGAQNAEDALFCSHCGVKMKYNEPTAQSAAPSDTAEAAEAEANTQPQA